MHRKLITPFVFTALLAGTAPAFALTTPDNSAVSHLNIHVELSAIANPQAAAYWSHLDADLKNAIAARLAGRVDPNGLDIIVRIKGAALAPTTGTPHLVGTVIEMRPAVVSDHGGPTTTVPSGAKKAYTLTIDASEAPTGLSPDAAIVISPGAQQYYNAMVSSFADYVVKNL